MLEITAEGVRKPSEEDIAILRQRFVDRRHVQFDTLIHGDFLAAIVSKLTESGFRHVEDDTDGPQIRATDPRIDYGLHYMLNQPDVLSAIGDTTGHPVHLWMGHSTLLTADFENDWHNDIHAMIELNGDRFQRVVPLLVVFTSPADGAELQIRRVGETDHMTVHLAHPGAAVLYHSGPGMTHRCVAAPEGEPAIVHVGWFHQIIQ